MPDARLARARTTLPSGYQFGDAARDAERFASIVSAIRAASAWRPWNEIAAEQLTRTADRLNGAGLSALTPPLTGPGADYSRLKDTE